MIKYVPIIAKYTLKTEFRQTIPAVFRPDKDVIEIDQETSKGRIVLTLSYNYFTRKCDIIVLPGTQWDGPSGPAVDSKNFMQASLLHDVIYRLVGLKVLADTWIIRYAADREMRKQCKRDGMSFRRRWWCYVGVRLGGGYAIHESLDGEVLTAP